MRRPVLAAAASLALLPATAHAQASYARCAAVPGTSVVQAARIACTEVELLAAQVAAAPAAATPQVVRDAGWVPLRARPDGTGGFDLTALRGTAAARFRRPGAAPDLDGWMGGRELVFSRRRIVAGARIPSDAATCSTAFLIRLRTSLAGLSAAHCAGLRRDGTAQRRNAALRRPPVPGIVLGRVQRMVSRSAPLDALVLPVPANTRRSASPVIDRGIARPPWVVRGTADLTAGRRLCFGGRTSGIDNCGRLRGSGARPAERFLSLRAGVVVRCTTARAAPGDSGAAVYTAPRADGTVRALGIATLVVGDRSLLCFTPIRPVLDRIGASVVTG